MSMQTDWQSAEKRAADHCEFCPTGAGETIPHFLGKKEIALEDHQDRLRSRSLP
jgi:hypothetical protein